MRDKEGIPRISGQDSERQVKRRRRCFGAVSEPMTGVIMTATGIEVFGVRVFNTEKDKDRINTTKSLILAQDER